MANWITSELAGHLNERNMDIGSSPVDAPMLAGLIDRIQGGTISGKIAKDVFRSMWNGEGTANELIECEGLKQIPYSGALESVVDEGLAGSQAQVEQYRAGQTKVLGYFFGQVMKAIQGKANPQQDNAIPKKKLEQDG